MNKTLNEIQQALHRLQEELSQVQAKLALLQEAEEGPPPAEGQPQRDPRWFRPSGHLSEIGIQHAYKLFEAKFTVEQVASAMGISIRGAAGRRASWLKERSRNPT